MPRKKSLSPTKITTYLACPLKYRYTYVDPRGKLYLRAKSYFSFGTSLHRVLERFHDSADTGVATTEEAVAALEESWIDAGYESAEDMMDAFGEGKEILVRHIAAEQARPKEGKTLFVEKTYQFDLGPFVLLGRIDRIDEIEPGKWRIVDYKSGRETVTEEEIRNDPAMGIYQLILKRKFPENQISAQIVALKSNDRAEVSLSDEELAQLESDILSIGGQILASDWDDVIPKWKPLCEGCDFRPLCSHNPDYMHSIPASVSDSNNLSTGD